LRRGIEHAEAVLRAPIGRCVRAIPSQDWKKLFARLDRDGSGSIDFAELSAAMRTHLHISHVRPAAAQRMRALARAHSLTREHTRARARAGIGCERVRRAAWYAAAA
jgi:hypothetical protein